MKFILGDDYIKINYYLVGRGVNLWWGGGIRILLGESIGGGGGVLGEG